MKGTKILKLKIETLESKHLTIKLKINSILGKFIIDTGSSNSCVDLNTINKFNLIVEKHKELASSAIGNINETYYSKNNILEIDSLQKTNFEVILFDMTHINNILKNKKTYTVDGILGSDILNEFNAIINYKKKLLTLKF